MLFVTGNNIRITGDLIRRVLTCNLDAAVERPELRKFSLDPVRRVTDDRGRYIAAAITIARSYTAAGRPLAGTLLPLAGFTQWSSVVREPLIWLGQEDPVSCMEQARKLDPERAACSELVRLWENVIGLDQRVTAAEIIKSANELKSQNEFQVPRLRELLIEQAGDNKGGIDARRLGRWLQQINGRIYDGFRIILVHKKAANRYALTNVEGLNSSSNPGRNEL